MSDQSSPEEKVGTGQRCQVVLIRHGSRERRGCDQLTLLTTRGKEQVAVLGDALRSRKIHPSIYLTSTWEHAKETGVELALKLNSDASLVNPLKALAPHPSDDSAEEVLTTKRFEDVIKEAQSEGVDLDHHRIIVIVGHEPKLSLLLMRMTGKRSRPFGRSEAVCVSADTIEEVLLGRATSIWRYPVMDYQEEQLREKIQSKLTVTSILAGFTFTALIEVLISGMNEWWRPIATLCLTAALALFIAAIYMYDRLSMPEGFWAYGSDRPTGSRWRLQNRTFEENFTLHGPLYALMVWTWSWVLTPGVIAAFVGFALIFLDVEGLNDAERVGMVTAVLVIAVVVALGYRHWRPRLGVD